MTRRAHNIDREKTAAANFFDRRSYWTNDGHEYLFGEDKGDRRLDVYVREKGKCQECGRPAGWCEGHMHHIKGGLVGRNDDLANLAWLCFECHMRKHVRVKSGVKANV